MISKHSPAIDRLRTAGFIVGDRDPRLNRAFRGRFMVCEAYPYESQQPTEDARHGPRCIVGDNLDALVTEAIAWIE